VVIAKAMRGTQNYSVIESSEADLLGMHILSGPKDDSEKRNKKKKKILERIAL